MCNSDRFEVSCLNSKSWPILKIQKDLNSQDVKDSEQFKTSLVSACFEAFCGPAKFQFSTDLKLNLFRVLWSLDQIQPNLVWMHLLTVENIWYGRKYSSWYLLPDYYVFLIIFASFFRKSDFCRFPKFPHFCLACCMRRNPVKISLVRGKVLFSDLFFLIRK